MYLDSETLNGLIRKRRKIENFIADENVGERIKDILREELNFVIDEIQHNTKDKLVAL